MNRKLGLVAEYGLGALFLLSLLYGLSQLTIRFGSSAGLMDSIAGALAMFFVYMLFPGFFFMCWWLVYMFRRAAVGYPAGGFTWKRKLLLVAEWGFSALGAVFFFRGVQFVVVPFFLAEDFGLVGAVLLGGFRIVSEVVVGGVFIVCWWLMRRSRRKGEKAVEATTAAVAS